MKKLVMRRTSLYEEHLRLNARMVEFAGWEMPVQYEGVVAEHVAVRTTAGIFDVSHMGEVRVYGERAKAFLQNIIASNLDKLYPGKVFYTVMCNERGGVVDDLLVYKLAEDDYLLVVNASMREKDVAWLKARAKGPRIEDVSDHYALIALQGPKSEEVLQQLTSTDLKALKAFHFLGTRVAELSVSISRTGYTGEDGFEIFVPWTDGPKLWRRLLEKAKPCGLGARDSLRLEAGLMLYGNDLAEDITPLEAPLKWVVDFSKDFIGKEVLLQQPQRKMHGFELRRGVARHGDVVLVGGNPAGAVTSGGFSPLLKKAIGFCLLPTNASSEVEIVVHGKPTPAKLRDTRFYVRLSTRQT